MTFALSWEADEIQAGGFLLFDAITSWNRSFTGAVTKHPIDGGSNVSDHYINNNPVFTMSAVISSADISTTSVLLSDENGNEPSNTVNPPTKVQISSTDQSVLMKYIPNTIGQFLPDLEPDVRVDMVRGDIFEGDTTEKIQDVLINLQSGEGYNLIKKRWETNIRPVNLFETDGFLTLVKKLPANDNSALIITSINFREDVESGYAIYADITFEQVRFTNLKKVTVPPELVHKPVQKKVATKKSLARCDSTPLPTTPTVEASRQNTVGIFPL